MTDLTTSSLPAEQARAEALLVKARRDTGNPDMTLDEAEAWWQQRRVEMGLPASWQSS